MAKKLISIDDSKTGEAALPEAVNAALRNTYAPRWVASTVYLAGTPVLLPNGKTGTRTADGTSRATFDATEEAAWTVSSGLPSGGTVGQVPIKGSGNTVAWGTPTADDTFARRRALTQIRRSLPGVLTKVALPAGFAWQSAPINIFRNGARYTTDFDVARFKNVSGKTIYVDHNVGVNTNDGLTEATAVLTLQNAVSKCAAGDTIMVISKGTFGRPAGMFGAIIRKSVNIIAKFPGETTYVVADVLTYTAHATAANVYTATRANVALVLDAGVGDSGGFAFTKVADAATCSATPGSWYQDGTTVGVRTLDGEAPTSARHIALLQDHSPFRADTTDGSVSLYLEGIRVIGGQSGNLFLDKTTEGRELNVYGKDCEFLWSTGPASGNANSVNIYGGDRAYFQRCVSAHSNKDGFNYAANNSTGAVRTAPKFIEVGCHSWDHGIGNGGSANSHNATTAHNGAQGIRINGVYHHTFGAVVADVQADTQSVNYSCDAFGSLAGTADLYDAAWSAQQAGTKMWLFDCSGFDAAWHLYPVSGSEMYVNDTVFDTSQGAGTLTVVNKL